MSNITFDDFDIKILKSYCNLSSTANSIRFLENSNKVYVKSRDLSIVSSYEMNKLFPYDVNIYDLRKFINIVGLFESPIIELHENYCLINQGESSTRYAYSNPELVEQNCVSEKHKSYLSDDKKLPTDIMFTLNSKHIKDIKRAQSVTKLPDVTFTAEDGNLYLKLCDLKATSGDIFTIKLKELKNENFTVVVTSSFKLLYEDIEQYIVHFNKQYMMARFISEKLNYMVALDMQSKFE